jgi:hypothetical protein
MPRYRTSLSLLELDRVIAGDRPTIDLFPFLLRHRGNRRQDKFTLYGGLGHRMRGTLEQDPQGTIVSLRPIRMPIFIMASLLGLLIVYFMLFSDDLTINGEPATPQSRWLTLPIFLLIPGSFLGFHLLLTRCWMTKLERDMKLDRLP